MATGYLASGVCHRSPEVAASYACAALHGPSPVGPQTCTGYALQPSLAVVFELSTPSGTQQLVGQLQPCPLVTAADLAPIIGALLLFAVVLLGASRIPRIFESLTYGASRD